MTNAKCPHLGLGYLKALEEAGTHDPRYSKSQQDDPGARDTVYDIREYLNACRQDAMAYWEVFKAVYGDALYRNVRSEELALKTTKTHRDGTCEDIYTPATASGLQARLELALSRNGLCRRMTFTREDRNRWLDYHLIGREYDPAKVYLEGLCSHEQAEYLKSIGLMPNRPCASLTPTELADKLFGDHDHKSLYQTYLTRWLISAVARVYEPGCQADSMIVLKGKQGIGKTSLLRVLFGDLYRGLPSHVKGFDRDRARKAAWGIELGEIGATFRAVDMEALKDEVTRTVDTWTLKHKEDESIVPRRCVYAATTNDAQFLNDPTGTRRFWVIDLGDRTIDTEWVKANRDSIWLMAKTLYKEGTQWHLTPEEAGLSEALNKGYQVENQYQDIITRMLVDACPEWAILPDDLQKALSVPRSDMKAIKAIASAMEALGYVKKQKRVGRVKANYYFLPGHEGEYYPCCLETLCTKVTGQQS